MPQREVVFPNCSLHSLREHHSPSDEGRAMTRVISEQFDGEEIPKNIRKMLVKGRIHPTTRETNDVVTIVLDA